MIIISNNCDILGDGKEDKDCNCSQDNLFKIAESLFLAGDIAKLGKFVGEMIDNCVDNPIAKKPRAKRAKRAPSAYNIFVGEEMKGCGKEGAKACKDVMKEAAAKWQEQKKQNG